MEQEQNQIQDVGHSAETAAASDQSSGRIVLNISNLILPGAILIAAVLISATLLYTHFAGNTGAVGKAQIGDTQKAEVSADDDPFLGNAKATVTVIEFSDYQCPFCRSFWKDTFPQIKSRYIDTGKIKFVYRDFPLSIHPSSHIAAEAADCAGDQGRYWEFQDKIFSEQQKLGTGTVTFGAAELKRWAGQIGLNTSEFNRCFDSSKYAAEVDKDLNDGTTAGVNGTPGFFINGQPLIGAQPFSVFQQVIESALEGK